MILENILEFHESRSIPHNYFTSTFEKNNVFSIHNKSHKYIGLSVKTLAAIGLILLKFGEVPNFEYCYICSVESRGQPGASRFIAS